VNAKKLMAGRRPKAGLLSAVAAAGGESNAGQGSAWAIKERWESKAGDIAPQRYHRQGRLTKICSRYGLLRFYDDGELCIRDLLPISGSSWSIRAHLKPTSEIVAIN